MVQDDTATIMPFLREEFGKSLELYIYQKDCGGTKV